MMAIDYTLMTKDDLVKMLQTRDVELTDVAVLDLKIAKLNEEYVKLSHRADEVLKIGALSSDEQTWLSQALLNRAAALREKITELTDLKAKLTL